MFGTFSRSFRFVGSLGVRLVFLHLLHGRGVGLDGQVKQLRKLFQRRPGHRDLLAVHQYFGIQVDRDERVRQVRENLGGVLVQHQQNRFPVPAGIVPLVIVLGFQHGAGAGVKIVFQRIPDGYPAFLPFPVSKIPGDAHIHVEGALQMKAAALVCHLNIGFIVG